MKITKQQIIKAMKRAERELDFEFDANVNHHRIHKNKKKYSRRDMKKRMHNDYD
jgi:hypothetical protein